MKRHAINRTFACGALAAAALSLSGCLSFGPKPPPSLISLPPAEQPAADSGRTIAPGQSVTVMFPHGPTEFSVPRVAVKSAGGKLAYIKGAQFADQPYKLLHDLFSIVIQARTGRPVLDGRNFHIAPGIRIVSQIDDFSIDADRHQADLTIDVIQQSPDGKTVTTRRFEGHAPVGAITADGVGPALAQAANQVAVAVADWIGR
jgi:cholesterol transport system auxiliary component